MSLIITSVLPDFVCVRVCVFLRVYLCVRVCLPHLSGIAPNITAGPSDSAVIDGMSVILHCETSGAPRPAITWQKGAWANSMRSCRGPGGFIMPHLDLSKVRRELWKGFRIYISSKQASLLYSCCTLLSPSCLFSLTFLQYPNLSLCLPPTPPPPTSFSPVLHPIPSITTTLPCR